MRVNFVTVPVAATFAIHLKLLQLLLPLSPFVGNRANSAVKVEITLEVMSLAAVVAYNGNNHHFANICDRNSSKGICFCRRLIKQMPKKLQ